MAGHFSLYIDYGRKFSFYLIVIGHLVRQVARPTMTIVCCSSMPCFRSEENRSNCKANVGQLIHVTCRRTLIVSHFSSTVSDWRRRPMDLHCCRFHSLVESDCSRISLFQLKKTYPTELRSRKFCVLLLLHISGLAYSMFVYSTMTRDRDGFSNNGKKLPV